MGDTAAFDYDPVEFGDHKVMAKALDDRVGCVILTELLKSRYSFDLYGCFTVQEEIGLKGAKAASYAVVPDVAIILEGTTCYDLTGTSEHMIVRDSVMVLPDCHGSVGDFRQGLA